MRSYLGFENRSTPPGGFSRGFVVLFVLLLIPAAAVWFFYRHLFDADTSVLVPIFLSIVTAWIWAYLIGYGADGHVGED